MHSTRARRWLRAALICAALLAAAAAAALGIQRASIAQGAAPGVSLNAPASFPVDI